MREKAWLFMHKLNMPVEFRNLKGLHSMILILFSINSSDQDFNLN